MHRGLTSICLQRTGSRCNSILHYTHSQSMSSFVCFRRSLRGSIRHGTAVVAVFVREVGGTCIVKACRSDDRDAYADAYAYAYAPLSFALFRFSCSDMIIIVVAFQVQTQTI